MGEQLVELAAEAAGGVDDPLPPCGANAAGVSAVQGSGGGSGGAEAGAAVAAVGLGGGVEDLGRERVDAASLARRSGGEPAVKGFRDTEQELLHAIDDITASSC